MEHASRQNAGVLLILVTILMAALMLAPQPAHAETTTHRIIRIGKQYLGTPYSQMNCSAFTREVYGRAVGVWMPANAPQQRFYGYADAPRRPGDLVLFKEHGPAYGITHVGIFVGRGEILHSSSYFGKVVISQIRYIKGYAGARRIT